MDTPIRYGLTLSSEEHPPRRLVEIGALAEENGFDFVSISDHYHPWIDAQGHSPFVWSVLGALAERTSTLGVAVGVTCPTVRIHPAILAQATATCAELFEGRFTWGVGSGEALNEHILGDRWPPTDVRLDMLEEAVGVVRELWTGEEITHRGAHYVVENARLYDPPRPLPPIVVSAFGPKAARLAADIGDGLWTSGTSGDVVTTWREAGGSGPVYSQLTLCWAEDRDKAVETAHRNWPNAEVPGQLSQDLPTPAHFEQASSVGHPGADRRVAGVRPRSPAGDRRRAGDGRRRRRPHPPPPDRPRPGGLLPLLDRAGRPRPPVTRCRTLLLVAAEPALPQLVVVVRWSGAPLLDTRLVVIAPHPDDEVLAAGGLMRWTAAAAAVRSSSSRSRTARPRTPAPTASPPTMLRDRRARERAEALARLGVPEVTLHRLGRPDQGCAAPSRRHRR